MNSNEFSPCYQHGICAEGRETILAYIQRLLTGRSQTCLEKLTLDRFFYSSRSEVNLTGGPTDSCFIVFHPFVPEDGSHDQETNVYIIRKYCPKTIPLGIFGTINIRNKYGVDL